MDGSRNVWNFVGFFVVAKLDIFALVLGVFPKVSLFFQSNDAYDSYRKTGQVFVTRRAFLLLPLFFRVSDNQLLNYLKAWGYVKVFEQGIAFFYEFQDASFICLQVPLSYSFSSPRYGTP